MTSERVLVFSLQQSAVPSTAAPGAEASIVSSSKQLLTVSHFELLSAKPISERDSSTGENKHYVEILIEQGRK